MMNTREQFEAQKKLAQITANFKGIELDLVLVKHKGYATRVSVLGNAISRAAYELWRMDGSRVRRICTIKPSKAAP